MYPVFFDPFTQQLSARTPDGTFLTKSFVAVGSSRILNNSDAGNVLVCTADSIVLTVPPGLPGGFNCCVISRGNTVIVAGSGVLFNGMGSWCTWTSDVRSIVSQGSNSYGLGSIVGGPYVHILSDLGAPFSASRAATVSGSPAVVDIGGDGAAPQTLTIVADVAGIDLTSGDESYRLSVQACNSSGFESAVAELAAVYCNGTGRFTMVGTTTHRYIRVFAALSGMTPSISLAAFIQ